MLFISVIKHALTRMKYDPDAPFFDASYHDIEVEFKGERHKLMNLPYNIWLQCTRCGGWELWQKRESGRAGDRYEEVLLAGEYDKEDSKLKVYFRDTLICGKE